MQEQARAILAELLSNASDRLLTTRPFKDKWSVGEILAHLAEDEIATAWRYRRMLEHDGSRSSSRLTADRPQTPRYRPGWCALTLLQLGV